MAKENKNTGKVPHRGKSSTPQLRFPGFEGEWEKCGIGEIISIKSDKYNPAIDKEEYPCIELESLSQGSGELLSTFNSKHQKSTKNVFHSGNVLFGKLRPYLKKYFLADFDGVCSSEIWVMKSHILNSSYLYAFVQSSYFMSLAEISSGSKMPRADWNLVSASTINYPKDLNEREKIGALFDLISQRIRTQSKTLLHYQSLIRNLRDIIFKQKTRFKDANGKEFSEWKVSKLKDTAERIVQKNSENNQNVLTISAQYGLINQLEFFNKPVSAKNLSGYYLLEHNDFTYNKSYSNGYPMGAIKRLRRYEKGIVSTLYICFRFSNKVNQDFMEQYFESGIQNVEIEKIAQEGARNHGLLNVGISDFFNIEIKLPSPEEQTKIANFLSTIDSKIKTEKKILEQLEKQKKYFLQQMFC